MLMHSIRVVGPERCVLSTDLGQTINPPVAEGFAMFAQKLLDGGFQREQIRRMAVTNPGIAGGIGPDGRSKNTFS